MSLATTVAERGSAIPVGRAWLLCGLLFLATALSFLDRQVLSVLAPRLTAEFGMSNSLYSRVVFAFVLSYTVMFSLGGRLMDALGTRFGLALSVGLWSVASAAHAFATGKWSLGAARFVLGIGEGACFPAATKGAVEWMPPERRALAVGLANGGSAFGAVLAPPLTAWWATMFGWRGAFVATALLGFLWLAGWQIAFRGLPDHHLPLVRGPKVSFRRLLARAPVRRLMASRFLFDPVFYFYMFWIPQYFARERGMSLTEIGALTWIPFFALGVTNIGAGRVSDLLVERGWARRRARLTLMLVAALLTPASWLAALAANPVLAIALMSLLMIAHGIWIANFITLIGDTVAPGEVGTAVGLTGTSGGIAGMLSSLLVGPVVDHYSFGPVFLVSALLYPAAWLVLAVGGREKAPSTAGDYLMKVERRKPRMAQVGIFGVGYHVYWKQFPGLLDELHAKLEVLLRKVQATGVCVTNFGIVDKAQAAYALLPRMKAADLDLVFCDMLTYATSATFAAIIRGLDVPIVLVALQPLAAMDYLRATTHMQLANDDFCSVPEFTGVAIRLGKRPPEVVLGTLENDPTADAEIADWCDVAMALHDLRRARIGHFGHPIEHMLDMQTDQAALTAAFGCHIVQTEADDLPRLARDLTQEQIKLKSREILDLFDTPDPGADPLTCKLTGEHLETAARAAVTLDKFIELHELDGLAYYYEGEPGSPLRSLVTNLIVGNSLLTAAGFPMCGESDLKTCIAMLLMDRIDIGGSFAEFHPVDFREGFVLVGHDGPHHINIADGKPVLRSLTTYHGKPGAGASVEFRIKTGPITMLSVGVTVQGRFKFVLAEGESVRGPIPATGNTNTRGFFKPDVRTFLKRWVAEGPTHHFALGVGHRAQTLRRIADALGIESVTVRQELC